MFSTTSEELANVLWCSWVLRTLQSIPGHPGVLRAFAFLLMKLTDNAAVLVFIFRGLFFGREGCEDSRAVSPYVNPL